jgi:hypothetical protein
LIKPKEESIKIAMSLSSTKLSAILATASTGLIAGCLTFASFVDVRSFLSHVKHSQTDLLQSHFAIWLPHGRDLMIPLILSSVASSTLAYRFSKHANFAYAALLIGCISPYTRIVMGDDTAALKDSSCEAVGERTERYCKLHHLRLVVAGVGFGLSLVALAEF